MAEREIRRMTVEEFLAWQPEDDERYELVDGLPRCQEGRRRKHASLTVASLLVFDAALDGRESLEPFTGNIGVRTGRDTVRRPAVIIDSGKMEPDDQLVGAPVVIVEISNDALSEAETATRLAEYRSLPSMRQILLFDPDRPSVTVFDRRPGADWTCCEKAGRSSILDLWSIGLKTPLRAFYSDNP